MYAWYVKTVKTCMEMAHLFTGIHVVFPEIQCLVLAEFDTLIADLHEMGTVV